MAHLKIFRLDSFLDLAETEFEFFHRAPECDIRVNAEPATVIYERQECVAEFFFEVELGLVEFIVA